MGKGISLEELDMQNKSAKGQIKFPKHHIAGKSKKISKTKPAKQFSEDFPSPKETNSLLVVIASIGWVSLITAFLFVVSPIIIDLVDFIISALGFVIDVIIGLIRIIFDVVGFIFDVIRGVLSIAGSIIDFLDPLFKFLFELAEVIFWIVFVIVSFPFLIIYYILMSIAGY